MIRVFPLPSLNDLDRRCAVLRQRHIVREADVRAQHEARQDDEGHMSEDQLFKIGFWLYIVAITGCAIGWALIATVMIVRLFY
jgi:hypothetical protein